MSLTPGLLRSPGGGPDAGALFRQEARRDGKVIATFEAVRQGDGSVVVTTTVTPTGKSPGDAVTRPFSFAHADVARRFTDEALEALEYLGCDVAS